MAKHWCYREPETALEAALQMAHLFAVEAKRQGDSLDYFRWRNVAYEISLLLPDPRQLSFVAE